MPNDTFDEIQGIPLMHSHDVADINGAPSPMSWKGDWDNEYSYAVGDGVRHLGKSYICIQAHSSINFELEPGVGSSWEGYWGLFSEDGAGVPAGGTEGQVLAKIDGTDYNTEWVDQTGGGSSDIDGGFANSVYLVSQLIDGGSA